MDLLRIDNVNTNATANMTDQDLSRLPTSTLGVERSDGLRAVTPGAPA